MKKPDIRTKKQREDIILDLTDRQYGILHGIAYEYGFRSPEELLEAFIADLTRCHTESVEGMFVANEWLQKSYYHQKEGWYYFRTYLYDNDLRTTDVKDLTKEMGFDNLLHQAYEDYTEIEKGKRHQSMGECEVILKEWSNEPIKGTNPGTGAHHPGAHAYS